MSKQRYGRTKGGPQPDEAEPFSAALAQELARGRSREEIIDRLVADGWSVGNASHFVNYIDAASTLANCLYAQEGQGETAQEAYPESRAAIYGTRSAGWGLLTGIGSLLGDIAGAFRRTNGALGADGAGGPEKA